MSKTQPRKCQICDEPLIFEKKLQNRFKNDFFTLEYKSSKIALH